MDTSLQATPKISGKKKRLATFSKPDQKLLVVKKKNYRNAITDIGESEIEDTKHVLTTLQYYQGDPQLHGMECKNSFGTSTNNGTTKADNGTDFKSSYMGRLNSTNPGPKVTNLGVSGMEKLKNVNLSRKGLESDANFPRSNGADDLLSSKMYRHMD
jgi:hypothetical protein